MKSEEVIYSRPPGWVPTPKPFYHHILSKAGLKIGYVPWSNYVEIEYRDA